MKHQTNRGEKSWMTLTWSACHKPHHTTSPPSPNQDWREGWIDRYRQNRTCRNTGHRKWLWEKLDWATTTWWLEGHGCWEHKTLGHTIPLKLWSLFLFYLVRGQQIRWWEVKINIFAKGEKDAPVWFFIGLMDMEGESSTGHRESKFQLSLQLWRSLK